MRTESARSCNVGDFRAAAQRKLPRGIFEFVDRGTEDDFSVRNNRDAFERITLRPRVLRNVSVRSLEVELFGRKSAMPLAIAPTGAAGLLWYEGEIAIARAAAAAGIPFTLSTASITSMEKVARQAGGRLWFQLYMWPDQSMSHQLVRRARDAGYEALIVTVDTAVTPNREYNRRNGFAFPFTINRKNVSDVIRHPRWLVNVIGKYLLSSGMPRFENFPEELRRSLVGPADHRRGLPKNDSLTWDDLRTLRRLWTGPLMVKGILHPDDAMLAADCGADAVIVSNHGGRNLDGSIAPLDALEEIAQRVGSKLTVMVDGGFQRGSDVVKALALGAKAVFIGRGPLWGVAADGERGASRVLTLFREEIDRVMGLMGSATVDAIDRLSFQHSLPPPASPRR